MHFADRLSERIQDVSSRLVVGIDPYPERLFGENSLFARSHPGLGEQRLLRTFCFTLLEAAKETACAVKPQVAFFESMGLWALEILRDLLREGRRLGIPCIADAKRGDIGSTAAAYAKAYLDPGSDFFADALTVNPYLGRDALMPFVSAAAEGGSGLFVLVKTSNPGSRDLQDTLLARGEGYERLYSKVATMVREIGAPHIGAHGYSNVGAVIGATYPQEMRILRGALPTSYLLLPGYGTQGAKAEDLASAFHRPGLGAIVNASRSIDYAYESLGEGLDPTKIGDAMYEAAKAAQEDINAHMVPTSST